MMRLSTFACLLLLLLESTSALDVATGASKNTDADAASDTLDLDNGEEGSTGSVAQEKNEAIATTDADAADDATEKPSENDREEAPVQSGPFIDLLGPLLYELEMVDEKHAQFAQRYTNEALKGKKVIGLYFSADWCGPCRQFTPELVTFYDKMNARRGQKDKFEVVWVSRCRDMNAYQSYFTHMKWLALPPEEAMGQRGQMLSEKYKVKGIPSLVLLDELGNVITTDARNKIPADRSGIGFPWDNPMVRIYKMVVPRSLRLMVKSQLNTFKGKLVQRVKGVFGMKSTA